MPIGKFEPVPLRELWKHEEQGFSAWLESNIEVLAETLDLSLSAIEREKPAGSFQVDITAEDRDGNLVIIENQLEPTNHDHLGKILTYLANLEAKTVIWVTSEPRYEHSRAVAWLNEMTPADIAFYLVRVSAYRIGDSDPAPLFGIVVAPSAAKDIGQEKKDLGERHILRLKFWEQLLARAKNRHITTHARCSPSKYNWVSASAGRSGLGFNYIIWLEEKTAVELYIDTGEQDLNKRIFDTLHSRKGEIEAAYGDALTWERLNDRRACRVRYLLRKGGLRDDEDDWPLMQDAMIDAMNRLTKALKPHIQALQE